MKGDVFQLVNVHEAQMSFPISNTTPIIMIAVVAPAKMAINPTIEYQAATVDIASAVKSVSNPKKILSLYPKNDSNVLTCSVFQPTALRITFIGSINDFSNILS